MPKKTAAQIAADDFAIISNAVSFNVFLRNGPEEKISENFPTLIEAEARAAEIRASHPGRDVLISATDAEGKRCPVLAKGQEAGLRKAAELGAKAKAPKKAAAAKGKATNGKTKAAKAKAPAKAKKAAKAPKKPAEGSKSEIVLKMLTRASGATRKAIVEATGGWNVDLKQFAARKGLKLRKDADGVIYATAK